MVKARHIVLFVAVVVVGYYAATELGLMGSNLDKVKAVDAEYGIGEEQLLPADAQSLKEYGEKLSEIEAKTPEEKSVLATKMSLVEMQESMFSLSENLGKIDFYEIDCGPDGAVLSAKKDAEDALAKANGAVSQSEKMGNVKGFEHITGETFSENMALVMRSLVSTISVLDQAC